MAKALKKQGRIQDLIRGAPDRDRPKLPVLCERSEPSSAWGPGPALGPQKLLGISLLNMHSLHFIMYNLYEPMKIK